MDNEQHILVKLENVSFGYDKDPFLKNINFEIRRNDFIGIIGPNGGGKTTLVKLILGLLKPSRGRISYWNNGKGSGNSVGYLPQINNVDHRFPISVQDVILSGKMDNRRIIRSYSKTEKQNAEDLMNEMGIAHLKKKSIGELSGGQMQRVFLCRAVIASPKLLILDEPNTYVDNKFESELYEKLVMLNSRMAILIVTHDMGMISAYVKSIACVNGELHYHRSNIITEKQLKEYNCPIQLITHGEIPHTVLKQHNH